MGLNPVESDKMRKEGREREARLELAREFLRDALVPRITDGKELDCEQVEFLIDEFKEQSRPREGSDFELPHVVEEAKDYLSRVKVEAEERGVGWLELVVAKRTLRILMDVELFQDV